MKRFQLFRKTQRPLFYIGFIISLGFLVLSLVVWLLGSRILVDNSERILEQRLVIVQLIADEIDRKFQKAITSLEQLPLFADFDPNNSDLTDEVNALAAIYQNKELDWSEIVFLNPKGEVIIAYPPEKYPAGTNLSATLTNEKGLHEQKVVISTPFQDPEDENILFVPMSVPVYSGDQFVGLFRGIFELNRLDIDESLRDAISLGKTAHAILVDEQGRTLVSTFDLPFLSPGEHQSFYQEALTQGVPVVETVPFELEFPGEPLGHLHVMALVPLKTVNWGMSMGGDVVAETFAGLRRLAIAVVLFSALSIVGVWAIAMLGARRVLTPVGETVLKFDMINKFSQAENWENLMKEIILAPSKIAPVTDSSLILFNPNVNDFEMIAQWNNRNEPVTLPFSHKSLEICENCLVKKQTPMGSFSPCETYHRHPSGRKNNDYCLQLAHQENLVGILHFSLPATEKLSDDQGQVFTSVASEMAIAIESFQLQRSNLNRVEITQTERVRIARQLHDTLGQNISYLRLKLDQFTGEDALSEISAIRAELEKMREVADETYNQVRGTLETLQADTTPHFESALINQARKYGTRSHFEIELTHEGQPYPLTGFVQRQILDITKEIFGNIEKHAKATKVGIRTVWAKTSLTITIFDNGVGFNVQTVDATKHFGLAIMQERVKSLNGAFHLTSSLDHGTEISIIFHNSAS